MENLINKIKNSSISKIGSYFLFKMVAYFISIISIPILTRKFSVADYGTISLIEANITLIASFCLLGIPQAYIRYYEVERKQDRITCFDSSTFFLVFVISIITFVISIGTLHEHYSNQLTTVIAIIVSVTVSNQQLLSYFRARGMIHLHSFLLGMNEIGSFLMPIMGIFLYRATIENYFLCKLLIAIFFSVIILMKIKPSVKKENVKKDIVKELLVYGVPLLLLSVGSTIYSNADRIIIDLMYGKEMVAYYSIPAKLSHALQQILIYPISMVIFPQYITMWERQGKEYTREYLNKGLNMYIFAICPIIMGSVVLREDLILFLSDERYLQTAYLVPILVTSLLIYGMYYFVASGFFLENKTFLLGCVMAGTSLVNIGLNLILGHLWGVLGIGVATGVSYLLFLGICSKISNRVINLVFPLKNALIFLVKALIMFGVLKLINIQSGTALSNIILNMLLGGCVYILLNVPFIKGVCGGFLNAR